MSSTRESCAARRRQARCWHPLLLGVVFTWQLYAANSHEFPASIVVLPLLVVSGAIGITWLILAVPARGLSRAAVATTFAWGLFLFYFVVEEALTGVLDRRVSVLGRDTEASDVLAVAWCGGILAGTCILLLVPPRKQTTDRLNRILNVGLAWLMVGILATHGYATVASWRGGRSVGGVSGAIVHASPPASDPSELPNIIYMILDGYGRDDVYRELYGYDNTPFLDALRERGFYIAEESRANYTITSASVSATLNMDYHERLLGDVSPETRSPRSYYGLIEDNAVVPLLKRYGYAVRNFSSIAFLMHIGEGDSHPRPWRDREFESGLVGRTPLRSLLKYYLREVKNTNYDYHRRKLLEGISFIRESYQHEGRGPVFVLSHVFFSHPPFVFGADGAPVNPSRLFTVNAPAPSNDGRTARVRARAADQIAFLNGKLLEAIDDVLAESSRPTVIVLQGDHGPGRRTDPSPRGLFEIVPILSAFRFPDGDYARLSPDMTPVNTFRVILSQYLEIDLPTLENRSFWVNHPYVFDRRPVDDPVTRRREIGQTYDNVGGP